MFVPLLGRLGIALLIFIFGAGAYRWYWHQVSTQATKRGLPPIDRPTILFFTAPDCAVCHVVQAPALAMLEDKLTESLHIIEVDVSEKTELAKEWKILSVPTLVILKADGGLASIKHGAHSAADLLSEIQPLYNS